MGNNKDIISPLLHFSTNYTTSHHTLAHSNIKESRNEDQNVTESFVESKEREKNMQSRWNPTPEQTLILEEVYNSGTRTPTTQQIQDIAAKLQKYGRIEGKNVFYWFQNHKSRERLKRRRPDQPQGSAINNVHEEGLRKENDKDSSSVFRRRADHRVIHTRTCLSSSHPLNKNIDDGKKEEDTCQNQINSITTSDVNYHSIITSKRSQETEHHNYDEEEEEEIRKTRTLDLFPVIENQEKTGLAEKNRKPNQLCCNYYYYYDFMPLKN